MADAKTTALTAATSWASGDLLYLVRDPAGTPVSRKITLDNVLANIVTPTKSTLNGAASTPPLCLTGTVFTGGSSTTTKPQFLIEPTGTTSTGWSTAGTGIGVNAATGFTGNLLDLQLNGAARFKVASDGLVTTVYGNFTSYVISPNLFAQSNTGGLYIGASNDVALRWDAANTLALRNSTNAQAFNIYNTYTSGSVYERGFMRWASNVLEIGTEHVGASNREVAIRSATGQTKFFTSTYNANTFTSVGVSVNGGLAFQSNTLGQHFILIGDSTGAGGPAELRTGSGFTLNWRSTVRSDSGSNDTGLARTIAGVVGVTNGSTGGGALGLVEITSPAAPATNGVYIFAEDNGGGKTRLMARFATGATQQLAIEP